ncbi:hypothetical protein DVH29_09700 [Pelagibacterium lacus]|uniref:Uncharacterized protein n=1 Tax=Pelagibacterium lacus TaxID=2282655 RepID=A0A369W497_9HYPH|nr:hypothetical protein DVH29_09700 [Pelagibacterium lacus]
MVKGLVFRVEHLETGVPDIELDYTNLDPIQWSPRDWVALGHSSVPGIWQIVGIGRLETIRQNHSHTRLHISTLFHFTVPIDVVTAGNKSADAAMKPLNVDYLTPDDVERLFGFLLSANYQQNDVAGGLAVAEGGVWGTKGGLAIGSLELELQDRSFFYRVAHAYTWQCCFLHCSQVSRDGLVREGVVVSIDGAHWSQGPVSQGLFLNPSMAFAFREGYLAVGDDYEILRSPHLDAIFRHALDVANPKALMTLPDKYEDWPDLEALTQHRKRFGY